MDHATTNRKKLIGQVSITRAEELEAIEQRQSASLEAKRKRAKDALGTRYVFHPEYQAYRNPHHSSSFHGSSVLSSFLQHSGAIAGRRVNV